MDSLQVKSTDVDSEYFFAQAPDSIKGDFVKEGLWKQGQLLEKTHEQVLENQMMIVQNQAESNLLIYKFGIINGLLLCLVILVVWGLRVKKEILTNTTK